MKTITTLAMAIALPFMATAQLQNPGFEQWAIEPDGTDQTQVNRPLGWTIDNGRGLGPVNANYSPVIEDALTGNYSLMLGVWYSYLKDMATQTAPISYRPAALKGLYKYTDAMLTSDAGDLYDLASVTVHLTKWNEAASRHDTIGTGHVFLGGTIFASEFECEIVYTSDEIPDSITVKFDCSVMDHEGYPVLFSSWGQSSLLTIDNIELIEEESSGRSSLGTGMQKQKYFAVYPNPTTDVVKFTDFKGDVEVYDATGKLVLSQKQKESISVLSLQPGLYNVKLDDGKAIHTAKFIKK
ncbi:T9SS type A sorting domain-containing protein [Flavobacterium sp. Sd200]|uniref:T9SS type A sorting domain-containing protein n=1 Tax=Flavobacterium sp. Sd200 TaxID=2692211 RepID=UPI00136FC9C0|nr:T9SS type A sorting domain-containing protein [Flavobacterium sp. Sd200]MXN90133.1 T9SS type A sorting domain-containing protein [Flavobacterium sp. Sd200]